MPYKLFKVMMQHYRKVERKVKRTNQHNSVALPHSTTMIVLFFLFHACFIVINYNLNAIFYPILKVLYNLTYFYVDKLSPCFFSILIVV